MEIKSLIQLIERLTGDQARDALIKLCERGEAKTYVEDTLLVAEDEVSKAAEDSDDSEGEDASQANDSKSNAQNNDILNPTGHKNPHLGVDVRTPLEDTNGNARVQPPVISLDDQSPMKRKRDLTVLRLEICENCEEEYDVTRNRKDGCQYHSGEMEVDWDRDFWADHDEDCHGIIDSEESREQYPKGFVWTCCNELGDTVGCEVARHEPRKYHGNKRLRY